MVEDDISIEFEDYNFLTFQRKWRVRRWLRKAYYWRFLFNSINGGQDRLPHSEKDENATSQNRKENHIRIEHEFNFAQR